MSEKVILDHVSADIAEQISPGAAKWFSEAGDPKGEQATEAATIAYDLAVNSSGQVAPAIALRGADGRLLGACLLDPVEATKAGCWLLESGVQAWERLISYAQTPEGAEGLATALKDQLLTSFLTVYRDIATNWRREDYNRAKTNIELAASAAMRELAEQTQAKARAEIEAEVRDKVLALARAASASSPEDRATELKALTPWIRELVEKKG